MQGVPDAFWGKLSRDEPPSWHPLEDHCADVAAVCAALLELPIWRRRFARHAGWDVLDDVTVARLVVLAALHDIGKLNLGFQAKGRPDLGVPERGHVVEGFGILHKGSDEAFTALGAGALDAWGAAVSDLFEASIAHHGRPPEPTSIDFQQAWWAARGGLAPLAGLRDLRARVECWSPLAFKTDGRELPDAPAFTHAFAGLVMLADWLGSDTRFFPYSEQRSDDPSARFSWALVRARTALAETGIAVEGARKGLSRRDTFSAVSEHAPNAAQRALANLPLPVTDSSSICVLESETGSGKTEAALARFVTLFAAGLVDGLYFALPTRTAATQIHGRVVKAAQRAFASPPPVVLAVPGYLRVDDVAGRQLAPFQVLWPDQDRFRFRAWAAEQPKRFLAGAIVVGTIDQVLLSSLQVGHAHLRATALQRHLLVVDEVHASDAYMTRILEEVLAHHAAGGGHALLLSATLGAEARSRLLSPNAGFSLARPSLAESIDAPYPALTCAGAHVASIVHDGRVRDVEVRPTPLLEHPNAVAQAALEAAAEGAKVLVLRNTVADCLETQAGLEACAQATGHEDLLFSCRGVIAPHHARYARADRVALDEAIEARFGKARPEGGCVVVATQTVQQSLDLDADVLLTDLCPMDVLLQRIGRLHRHERIRPAGFNGAIVHLLVPGSRDLGALIRSDGRGSHHHGLGSVYDDLRVLEATWRCVERTRNWTIPHHCRRLVEQSVHSDVLAEIVRELGGVWALHAQSILGGVSGQARIAELGLVDRTKPYAAMPFASDRKIQSRLGESDRLVSFATGFVAPFGDKVDTLSLRAAWARGAGTDETEATDVELLASGGARFMFADRRFVYDRLGLRPHEEPQIAPTIRGEDDDA